MQDACVNHIFINSTLLDFDWTKPCNLDKISLTKISVSCQEIEFSSSPHTTFCDNLLESYNKKVHLECSFVS